MSETDLRLQIERLKERIGRLEKWQAERSGAAPTTPPAPAGPEHLAKVIAGDYVVHLRKGSTSDPGNFSACGSGNGVVTINPAEVTCYACGCSEVARRMNSGAPTASPEPAPRCLVSFRPYGLPAESVIKSCRCTLPMGHEGPHKWVNPLIEGSTFSSEPAERAPNPLPEPARCPESDTGLHCIACWPHEDCCLCGAKVPAALSRFLPEGP